MAHPEYLEINKLHWNQKVDIHYSSEFYGVTEFLSGKSSLKKIELDLLNDIKGKSLLHLQCHFGLDSISLARLGAEVTGVDFSDMAIVKARELAEKSEMSVQFVLSDVYSLPEVLSTRYDLIFSSYGTIGWLPDIEKWAGVVAHFLKPGGIFVFAEFHPVVWMMDDDFEKIAYRYFNSGPIEEIENNTYADRKALLPSKYVGWNHGLSEVIQALLNQGLKLEIIREFDYSPFNCFKNMEEFEPGKFRIKGMANFLPMVYALRCIKTNER